MNEERIRKIHDEAMRLRSILELLDMADQTEKGWAEVIEKRSLALIEEIRNLAQSGR